MQFGEGDNGVVFRLEFAGIDSEDRSAQDSLLELLYGMPMRQVVALARKFAAPVRVYIPFGIAWRPYAASKVAEDPRILWWLVRDGVDGLLGRHRS